MCIVGCIASRTPRTHGTERPGANKVVPPVQRRSQILLHFALDVQTFLGSPLFDSPHFTSASQGGVLRQEHILQPVASRRRWLSGSGSSESRNRTGFKGNSAFSGFSVRLGSCLRKAARRACKLSCTASRVQLDKYTLNHFDNVDRQSNASNCFRV